MSSILELESLGKTYGSGRTAIRAVNSVNLEVKPGEIVLIMGPSGSGKTTLSAWPGYCCVLAREGFGWMVRRLRG